MSITFGKIASPVRCRRPVHSVFCAQDFRFLLDDRELMAHFIDVVRSQPFENRYRWFYEHIDLNRLPLNSQEAEANVIKV